MAEVGVEELFRAHFGRVLASVRRTVPDLDLAEEATQEAFAAALARWPRDGPPRHPVAWLAATARHKAIDRLRRAARFGELQGEVAYLERLERDAAASPPELPEPVPDERLRLLFTCCHPALPLEARVALCLRTLCGLGTVEIARAFLVSPATLAQRVVRAKRRLRELRVPYELPAPGDLPERLDAVLAVLYLLFNEGYAATAGEDLLRTELCSEAVRLTRTLVALLPGEAEARGLLALLLLQHARRAARVGPAGAPVLLDEQDRSLWDRAGIAEGLAELEAALGAGAAGPYTLQAAIAACHARAARASETDWPRIAALYGELARRAPSPVVELNRAVALVRAHGPEEGLPVLERLAERPEMARYHLFWAVRADCLLRLGRRREAAGAYRRALGLAGNAPERRLLAGRLAELEGGGGDAEA